MIIAFEKGEKMEKYVSKRSSRNNLIDMVGYKKGVLLLLKSKNEDYNDKKFLLIIGRDYLFDYFGFFSNYLHCIDERGQVVDRTWKTKQGLAEINRKIYNPNHFDMFFKQIDRPEIEDFLSMDRIGEDFLVDLERHIGEMTEIFEHPDQAVKDMDDLEEEVEKLHSFKLLNQSITKKALEMIDKERVFWQEASEDFDDSLC